MRRGIKVTVRTVRHREVTRFAMVTQQAASEPGHTVGPVAPVCRSRAGCLLGVVMDHPLCISCGFLGCTAASPVGPAPPTGHIPGLLLMMDAADECCPGEIKDYLEGQTWDRRAPGRVRTEFPRLLWRNALFPLLLAHHEHRADSNRHWSHHSGTDVS